MRFDYQNPTPLVEAYPALGRRKQYFDDDEFLRFLVVLIAPDSPIADERNWDRRVQAALDELELSEDSEVYERFEAQSDDVLEQMFQLFIIFGDIVYEEWLSQRINFAIMAARMRDGLGLKDADRLRYGDYLSKARVKLLELEAALFKGDTFLRDLANDQALEMSLSGYAEQHALTLEDEDL